MSISRYPTTHIKTSNSHVFVTEKGFTYKVYFDTNSGIFPDGDLDKYAIYIGFTCVPKQEPYSRDHDPLIESTIMWLIANVFKDIKWATLLYVCSPIDDYARHRSITFRKWHRNSRLQDKIIHLTNKIGDTYTGALFSKKNPMAEKIEFVFNNFDPTNKFDITEEIEGVEEMDDDYGFEEEINL